jgi:hypothetical protein
MAKYVCRQNPIGVMFSERQIISTANLAIS